MTAAAGPRVPLATYRLQLGSDLTFDDAARVLDYLAALGVSDCYTSPFFETSAESSHGYDVSDHNRIRAELGGEAAFARFVEARRRHGLGLLIDVVPNHMGIAKNRNAWWLDVLEYGPASGYAHVFDIDWAPVKRELAGKVLQELLKSKEDGRVKLYVIRQALACRRARAALFREGDYRPLEVEGPLADHVCAFARLSGDTAALTVVPRLLARRGVEEPPLGHEYWGEETRLRVPPEAGSRLDRKSVV